MPIETDLFEEWLDYWGSNGEIVQAGVNIKIGQNKGIYYGEWKEINSVKTPNGRGLLKCSEKLILGHIKNGDWAA